jgi:hypothetical protein
MQFKALVPMLQAEDIGRTKEWYESTLGFVATGVSDDWLRLVRDGVSIMFMRNEQLGTPSATATQYIRRRPHGSLGSCQGPLLGGMGA